MREKPQKPFFVSNGDVLTKVNVSEMLDFHIQNKALITVGIIIWIQRSRNKKLIEQG